MKVATKLLKQNTKTKRSRNVSAHRNARKAVPSNSLNRKPASVVQIQAASCTDNHAERLNAHRRRLELINDSYLETTQDVISDRVSLPKQKKARLRRNLRQFGQAMGDWWCDAVDLLESSQQAALMRMLPDLKAGTNALMRVN